MFLVREVVPCGSDLLCGVPGYVGFFECGGLVFSPVQQHGGQALFLIVVTAVWKHLQYLIELFGGHRYNS